MYQALYRKWRPRSFDDVISQPHITTALRNQIREEKTAHAYLFTGSRGTGKTTCARILAKTVNCEHRTPEGNPCLECEICRDAERGALADIIEIDAASNNSVEDIRDLREGTVYLPERCRYKVYIIDEVHMLSPSAWGALLKVMEEPPEGVLFLLTADSLASVLPTIRSRCVSFAVAPVSPADCTRYCAAQGVDKKTAALYSELFDGHIGTVLAVARDEARAAQVEKALELARAAAARDGYTAAVLLAAYEKDKAAAAALLTDFRAVAAAGLRSSPRAPVQGTQARQAVRLADAALQRLGAQVNPKVVLSVFAAKLRTL